MLYKLFGSMILSIIGLLNGVGWIFGFGYGAGISWKIVILEILICGGCLYLINTNDKGDVNE